MSLMNIDNDTAEIIVSPTSGLVTTEAGATASFTVVLTSQPMSDTMYIVAMSSNLSEGDIISDNYIRFTRDNWNIPQVVTIAGRDDYRADGDCQYTIVLDEVENAQEDYSGWDPADVSVTNKDDDVVGIVAVPQSGLVTTEGGTWIDFRVTLTSEPTADVIVWFSSSDATEGSIYYPYCTLRAGTGDWFGGGMLRVIGVDDSVVDGDQPYLIILIAQSDDPKYSGLRVDVSATNADND